LVGPSSPWKKDPNPEGKREKREAQQLKKKPEVECGEDESPF